MKDSLKPQELPTPTPINLRQSEDKFQSLANNSPDVIIRFDKYLNFIYANPAIKIPTGISAENIVGTQLCNFPLSPQDYQLWKTEITKVLKTKKSVTFQSEFRKFQKRTFHFHARLVPEINSNGSVESVLCTLRNITDLKRAEQSLKKNQARIQNLLNAIPDTLFILDKNGTILDYQASQDLFPSLSATTFKNKNIFDILPLMMPKIMHYFGKAFTTNTMQSFEFQSIVDSNICYYEGRITANNKNDFILIIRDISEFKLMQQHLTRFDRLHLVGEMAVSIGHEIRNPMTTVRGFLQMFSQRNTFQNYTDLLDLMMTEIDHANKIISEFISLAKNKALTLESQNLNALIQSLLPLIEAEAIITNKKISTHLEPIPNFPMDDKEIRQLILNIVQNGLESMSPRSQLDIRTYLESEKVILAIKDQGTGIAPEHLEKIATPFFSTKVNQLGLGLATCYNIAHRHHAEIMFDTSPFGTTFYVKFDIP
ncbi:MAG: sensor signal transduction histidine kinase [Pelosinus sp.]|jgi:PAS domain S-box-containing protein|nr:sensor signal transduction histidine kinase [Pelosinus sp.]